MSILEGIKGRKSAGKMTGQHPSREQIERLLEAATHAPNHHNAQPWRFMVLAGQARVELGEIMAERLLARMGNLPEASGQALLAKERSKLLRAPVIIVAAAEYPRKGEDIEIENVEATAAAVQNMLLAAHEQGLSAMWRTGEPAYDPSIKQWLGLDPQDHIVAFLYIGYPAYDVPERQPVPAQEKTRWLGWEA